MPIITHDKRLYSFFNLMLTEKQQARATQKSFADDIKEVLLSQFGGQISSPNTHHQHFSRLKIWAFCMTSPKITFISKASKKVSRKELRKV
jgi:hypothetical protein